MRADAAPPHRDTAGGPDFSDASASELATLHLTESIQSHGVLAALDANGVVTHLSANASELLGASAPVLGECLRPEHVAGDAQLLASLNTVADKGNDVPVARHRQVALNCRSFDLLVHHGPGPTLVEWEWCEQEPERHELGPALHRIVKRLRAQCSVQALLDEAVRSVHALTGFDRTMAYHLRRDEVGGGGDVVAEVITTGLEPFLGRSFPDEAMPREVRRLYQLNSVRLVADANSAPVPLNSLSGHDDAPFDLTHAVLRSATRIPIEYLRRSGMNAAMSMPLVIEGQMWGVIICHHRTRLHVPYPVRAVCAVLSELVSAQLQSQLEKDRVARERRLERLRTTLLDQIQSAAEPAQVLPQRSEDLLEAFQAQAVLISHQSLVHTMGDVPPALWAELRRWLAEVDADDGYAYATESLAQAAPHLADRLAGWAGLLSICFDPTSQARILLLRRESVETVTWGAWPVNSARGRALHPDKASQEELRGFSAPWSDEEIAALDALGADLRRLVTVRMAEMHRYRTAVRAMLHAPAGEPALPETLAAANRFERVLHQAMELSLLRQGMRPLVSSPVNLGELLARRITAAQQRHRGASIYFDGPSTPEAQASITVHGEPERLARLLDGLLENAIRHGQPGESVVARVSHDDGPCALVEISNISPPIDRAVVDILFSATEPAAIDDSRSGLGFGLYIGQTIAQAHGGSLAYAYEEPFVTMSVRLPAGPPA